MYRASVAACKAARAAGRTAGPGQTCQNVSDTVCPTGGTTPHTALPFPDGIACHLVETGYGPLPSDLPGLTMPVASSR
jgi:hypothetical protein